MEWLIGGAERKVGGLRRCKEGDRRRGGEKVRCGVVDRRS